MSLVNRQLYKQKPQAWGPVSAVQASIFKNAERMGIDPGAIKAVCIGGWAGIGLKNLINSEDFIQAGGSLELASGGLQFTHNGSATNDYFIIPDWFHTQFIDSNENSSILCYGRWDDYHHVGSNAGYVLGGGLNLYMDGINSRWLWKIKDDGSHGFEGENYSFDLKQNKLIGVINDKKNNVGYGVFGAEKIIGSKSGLGYRSTTLAFYSTVFIGRFSSWTNYYGFDGIFDLFFAAQTTLSDFQIAYLSDNPYALIQRVAPVFYSVPGGTEGVIISSTTGTVVVTGYDVGIETGVTISVNTGIITGTGFNVEVEQGTSVQVTTGEISINGLNPDIVQGTQFIVTQGMVAINGFDTTVLNGTQIDVILKNVNITGHAVEVEQGIIITSSIESIIITGYNVSVTNELVISLKVGSVIIAGYNTTVLAGTKIDLTKAEITITGLALEIEQGTQIDVTSETVIVTGLDVSVENTLSINVTTGSVNVLGYPVNVSVGILVEATTGNVAITGYNPTVAQSSGVEVTTGQVTITGLDTIIECTVLIEPTTGMVIIASYDVTVTDGLVAETPITRTNVVAASNRVITNSGSSRLMTNSNFSRLIVIT